LNLSGWHKMEPTPSLGSVLVQENEGEDDQALEEDAGEVAVNLTLGSVLGAGEVKKKSPTSVEVNFVRSQRRNLEIEAWVTSSLTSSFTSPCFALERPGHANVPHA
jgi:hypothetical protein